MTPWWSLRGAGRQKAKSADEADDRLHPVLVVGAWKRRGKYHPFRDDAEKALQYKLASGGLPSAPKNLTYEMTEAGGWVAQGCYTGDKYELGEPGDSVRIVSIFAQAAGRAEFDRSYRRR